MSIIKIWPGGAGGCLGLEEKVKLVRDTKGTLQPMSMEKRSNQIFFPIVFLVKKGQNFKGKYPGGVGGNNMGKEKGGKIQYPHQNSGRAKEEHRPRGKRGGGDEKENKRVSRERRYLHAKKKIYLIQKREAKTTF